MDLEAVDGEVDCKFERFLELPPGVQRQIAFRAIDTPQAYLNFGLASKGTLALLDSLELNRELDYLRLIDEEATHPLFRDEFTQYTISGIFNLLTEGQANPKALRRFKAANGSMMKIYLKGTFRNCFEGAFYEAARLLAHRLEQRPELAETELVLSETFGEGTVNPCRFVVVFPQIGGLWTLTSLSLASNDIPCLQPQLFLLTNLEVLQLDKNRITTIPREIKKLKKLRRFSARENQLIKLPGALCQLANLEVVDLSDNNLLMISLKIGLLRKLVHLGLSNNQVREIPKTIFEIKGQLAIEIWNNPCSLPVCLLNQQNFTITGYKGSTQWHQPGCKHCARNSNCTVM